MCCRLCWIGIIFRSCADEGTDGGRSIPAAVPGGSGVDLPDMAAEEIEIPRGARCTEHLPHFRIRDVRRRILLFSGMFWVS